MVRLTCEDRVNGGSQARRALRPRAPATPRCQQVAVRNALAGCLLASSNAFQHIEPL